MQKTKKEQIANAVGANCVRPHFGGITKENKGITLIALIITIIVMIILVGVTINVALNGGLFNTASTATQKTEKKAIYDQIVGTMKLTSDGNVNVSETYSAAKQILESQGRIVGTLQEEGIFQVIGTRGTYTYKITEEAITIEQENAGGEFPTLSASYLLESNYTLEVEIEEGTRKITIPEGFGVVNTTGDTETLIEDITEYETYITAGNIKNGIVIQDVVGNEFVWIPVDNINSMVMCQSAETVPEGQTDGTCTIELDGDTLKCTKHNSEALAGRVYTDTTSNTAGENFNANLTEQTYNAISGFREPANLTGTKKLSETDVGTTGVEPGKYAYDSQEMFTVYGGGTFTDSYQTEFNLMAKSVAKNKGFYVGRYETGGFNEERVVSKQGRGTDSAGGDINNTTWYKMYKMQKDFGSDIVGSSMIWGCQYDQVMKFVDGKIDGIGETFSVTTADSSRHSGDLTIGTGNNISDFVTNLYDLEGNMWEWTLEVRSTNRRVWRGGCSDRADSASFRSGTFPSDSDTDIGSRLALYIK